MKLAATGYLGAVLAILTGPLMARALGPEGRGEVAAVAAYTGILTVALSFGLPAAVGYFAATGTHPANAVLAAATRFAALLGIPMLAISAGLVLGPLAQLSTAGRAGATALFVLLPVAILGNCLNSMLVAEGALRPLTTVRIMSLVTGTLATVVMYALGLLNVGSAILVMAGISILTTVASWQMVSVRPRGRLRLLDLLRFGLRGYGANVAVLATHMIDQVVILRVLGARALGFYAVAVTISSLPTALSLAVYSRYFTMVAGEPDAEVKGELMSAGLRVTFLASVTVSVLVAAVSPIVIPLFYGREFEMSVLPLLLLVPGTIASSVALVGESFLTAVGKPGRVTVAEFVGLAVTLVGLPFVIPRFGITGAAILSSVSYTAVLVATLVFLRQASRLSLRPQVKDLTPVVAIVGTMARRVWRYGRRRSVSSDGVRKPADRDGMKD